MNLDIYLLGNGFVTIAILFLYLGSYDGLI